MLDEFHLPFLKRRAIPQDFIPKLEIVRGAYTPRFQESQQAFRSAIFRAYHQEYSTTNAPAINPPGRVSAQPFTDAGTLHPEKQKIAHRKDRRVRRTAVRAVLFAPSAFSAVKQYFPFPALN